MDPVEEGPLLNGDFTSLGLIDCAVLPHYTNEPFAKACETIIEKYSNTLDLKPINNFQVFTVSDNKYEILTNNQ